MSIYKNEEGRHVMAQWYEKFLGAMPFEVEESDVETSFGRTHILTAGPKDAPPLLCFHGAMASAASSFALFEPVVKHFRVVFPDTVGQPGRSAETHLPMRGDVYGRWASEVMDGVHLSSASILGASMGAYIALNLAKLHPERVSSLALWCPAGLVNCGPLTGLGLMVGLLSYYMRPSDKKLRGLFALHNTNDDEVLSEFYGHSMRYLKMDRGMPQVASKSSFAELSAPVLLFANELDLIFPANKLVSRSKEIFPNLEECDILKGFRHVPPFHDPRTDKPWERIIHFLQRHAEGESQNTARE